VLRRIFGPREEATAGWKELHNVKVSNSYPSIHIIRIGESALAIIQLYILRF
jgi:hypothetical protein